jgi:hypothetical protein
VTRLWRENRDGNRHKHIRLHVLLPFPSPLSGGTAP